MRTQLLEGITKRISTGKLRRIEIVRLIFRKYLGSTAETYLKKLWCVVMQKSIYEN